jgi:predicted tellurium resistance membrane protein TerC
MSSRGYWRDVIDVQPTDLVTIALLVALEGLLSADNAMVLAVLVLGLPRNEQQKALRYGILGAFAFRITATLFAAYMIRVVWVQLLGAVYLLYLPLQHFLGRNENGDRRAPKPARPWLGLTAFWATVVKVELTDIVFAIDSILLALVTRYPALVDGAFIIIAWVGIKLLLEYLHNIGLVHFLVPRWLSLGLIVVIFVIAFWYARKHGPAPAGDDGALDLLADQSKR